MSDSSSPEITPPNTPIRKISLGSLDLTGLDLINLDLDVLTNIASESQRGKSATSPEDAFANAKRTALNNQARNGQELYAESLTSGDGSGSSRRSSSNSMSSKTSESSFSSAASMRSGGSNRSNRSNRSNKGQRLIALGLGAAEVVALRSSKKTHRSTATTKTNQTLPTGPKPLTDKQAAKQIRKEYLASFRDQTTYLPLTKEELIRLTNLFPKLSELAVDYFSVVFDRISPKHQRLIFKHSRRFEYEFRTRSLGGKRKDKQTESGKRSILLGEFLSKHVFMIKTRHLVQNGDLLFLQLFNMFMASKWKAIVSLRKQGFASFRESISMEMDFIIERFCSQEETNQMSTKNKNKNKKKNNKGFWLMGLHMETKGNLVPDSPRHSSSRDSRRSRRDAKNILRKKRKEEKKKSSVQSATTTTSSSKQLEKEFTRKERRSSSNPTQFEEFVDESGERIYIDTKSGRRISSKDLATQGDNVDPYDGWDTIIDGYGRTIYIHPQTGESVVKKQIKKVERNKGTGYMNNTSTATPTTTTTTTTTTTINKPRRKSLAHRAVRKVGKWLGVKKSRKKNQPKETSSQSDTSSMTSSPRNSGNSFENFDV